MLLSNNQFDGITLFNAFAKCIHIIKSLFDADILVIAKIVFLCDAHIYELSYINNEIWVRCPKHEKLGLRYIIRHC